MSAAALKNVKSMGGPNPQSTALTDGHTAFGHLLERKAAHSRVARRGAETCQKHAVERAYKVHPVSILC